MLAVILVSEYGLLGLIAGTIATGFAVALSLAVTRLLMDIEWEFEPGVAAAGVIVTALLVTVVGAAASFDVLFRKPLSTLRSQ
jgi:predicted lysophospholipase L1 biosynthesis ABC-type transport system permease subunit